MSEEHFSILEEKHTMRMLMLIMDNPGINKTQVMRSGEGGERAKFERIEQLINLGYLQITNAEHWNAMGLEVTEKGKSVVKQIKMLHETVLDNFS